MNKILRICISELINKSNNSNLNKMKYYSKIKKLKNLDMKYYNFKENWNTLKIRYKKIIDNLFNKLDIQYFKVNKLDQTPTLVRWEILKM